MADPFTIVTFAESLSPSRCKIQNTPDLIFLCGGPTASDGPCLSARDFFFRYLLAEKPELARRVKLAEEVNDWFRRDQPFPDLLELEKYLVHLASMTVLFVEGPGSIAELGAFAVSDDLRPKTLAVLNEFFGTDRSFIADGPVLKLDNEKADLVHYYNWNPEALNSASTTELFGEMSSELVGVLEARDSSRSRTVKLDLDSPGHTLLVVADLIRIAGVTDRAEILLCLQRLSCEKASKELERHLSILESVGIITKRRRSNKIYFVRRSPLPFIQYAFEGNEPERDLTRIQADIREGLDKAKRGILSSFLRMDGPNE